MAVPNGVCVDQSWNDSQTVSSIGNRMKMPIKRDGGRQHDTCRGTIAFRSFCDFQSKPAAKGCVSYFAARSRMEAASAWALACASLADTWPYCNASSVFCSASLNSWPPSTTGNGLASASTLT